MISRYCVWTLTLVVALTDFNRAAAQVPATEAPSATATPATRAVTPAPADGSTPRGALKAFTLALDAGDRAKIAALLHAGTDSEKKLAGATADLAEATAVLRRAATKSFGDGKSRPLGVDSSATTEAVKRIDTAEEKIDGERATVRESNSEGPPLTLVKVKGEWRLPVSELIKDVEPADVDRSLADVAAQTKLLRELAAEVDAGKYKTAVEARQALDKRVMQSAIPQSGPHAATKAATKP